jgi:hypothetical protein
MDAFRLPAWMIVVFAIVGLVGLCLGVSGMVMTGSFAVSGSADTAEIAGAHWKHVQHWYDALTAGSLLLLVAGAVSIGRRRRGRQR